MIKGGGGNALREKEGTSEISLRSLERRTYMSRGILPLLLIIVPDRSQQDRVTRLVQEVFGATIALYVRITIQDLLQEPRVSPEVLPRKALHHLRALFDLQMIKEEIKEKKRMLSIIHLSLGGYAPHRRKLKDF